MRILSIDPANKSLAISIIDFNFNWKIDLDRIKTEFNQQYTDSEGYGVEKKIEILLKRARDVSAVMDNLFTLKYINVFDLLPDQKVNNTSTEIRLGRLKGVIEYIKKINGTLIPPKPIEQVLVEKQMSQKNMEVSSALIYAFTEPDFGFVGKSTHFKHAKDIDTLPTTFVNMVGASLKSKVYFGSAGHIQNFRKKYAGNYTANKAHSKYNFLEWVKSKNNTELIEGIPKKNIDDIADSFLMAYAWCIKKYEVT